MIRPQIDVAIGESEGNGGDVQKLGNDIAIITSRENYVYLSFFGGNLEESTPAVDNPNRKAKDYWANSLLYKNNPAKQMNSSLERTLQTTALTSAGRIRIENAARDDLKWITNLGAQVTVTVTLPWVNSVKIEVKTIYPDGEKRLSLVTFKKKGFTDGDFSPVDFSDDFY